MGVNGCEPIVPMFQLLAGSSMAGAPLLTYSALWLAVAVILKSAVFAYLEPRIPRKQAAGWMFTGNIISTIPGVFTAFSAGMPMLILPTFPAMFFLGWVVKRRMDRLGVPTDRRISGVAVATYFCVAYLVSLFLCAGGIAMAEGKTVQPAYWAIKLLYVTLLAVTGLLMSSLLEEAVIARLARPTLGNTSFFHSVVRANYVTLGFILLVAAIKILPSRWNSPNFLVPY